MTQYVDNYITGPARDGNFPEKVERNAVFEVDDTPYQVRVEQSYDGRGSTDYALLMRWSLGKEDWSIVAKRKPRERGIWAPGTKHDPRVFDAIEDELVRMAEEFEDLRTSNFQRSA